MGRKGVWRSEILGRLLVAIRGNLPLMFRLKRVTPSPLWSSAKNLYGKIVADAPALTPEMRHEVSNYFREDTLRIQELVRLDLSDWLDE